VGGRRGSVMVERKGERRVWGHRQREKTGRKINGSSNDNKSGTT
jgi:hypothetical protein